MAQPVTRSDIVRCLQALGVRPGDVVMAHVSLSAFGFVVGGPISVCLALRDAVGGAGTLVMPGFTPQLCHPASWRAGRLDGADPERLAAEMPYFDPAAIPVNGTMGVTAECFRALPGTSRSNHPHTSFLARGPLAQEVVGSHPLAYRFSRHGPLGRLADLDAKVLLMGVPWARCTAFHLAEYEVPYPGRRRGRWPVPVKAGHATRWELVDELLVWEGDFDEMGSAFQAASAVAVVPLGAGSCTLASVRDVVGFAMEWLPAHRNLTSYGNPPGWLDIRDADTALALRTR